MKILLIGAGLGGTAVADEALMQMEKLFADVLVYELYRACVEGPEEEAKAYIGIPLKKAQYAERIAMYALRGWKDEVERKQVEKDADKIRDLIRKDPELSRDDRYNLLSFLKVVRRIMRQSNGENRFHEILKEVLEEMGYIEVLMINSSRQDRQTIEERQKTMIRVGVDPLGNAVEIPRLGPCIFPMERYLLVGEHMTHGGGAGWDNTLGLRMGVYEEDSLKRRIDQILRDLDAKGKAIMMVAVVYGSGGGTGSGMAPIICKVLKEIGEAKKELRVVAFSILPAKEECRMRAYNSVTNLAFVASYATGVAIVPLEDYVRPELSLKEAYDRADRDLAMFFVLMGGAEELISIKSRIKERILKELEVLR